jgi:hypothetical protein
MKSSKYPNRVEAVTLGRNEWRVLVDGELQSPMWESSGPAIIFGNSVADGTRKAEPASTAVIRPHP